MSNTMLVQADTDEMHSDNHERQKTQKPPNIWLEVDLAGFGPRIWIIGIQKVVLINWVGSRLAAKPLNQGVGPCALRKKAIFIEKGAKAQTKIRFGVRDGENQTAEHYFVPAKNPLRKKPKKPFRPEVSLRSKDGKQKGHFRQRRTVFKEHTKDIF
jgi:hypothetical protein